MTVARQRLMDRLAFGDEGWSRYRLQRHLKLGRTAVELLMR